MRLPVKLAPLALAVCAALSAGSSAHAQPPSLPTLAVQLSFSSRPTLTVEHITPTAGGTTAIFGGSIGGSSSGAGPGPARVAVEIPPQYQLDLSGTPGTSLGIAFLVSSELSGNTASALTIFGDLSVADPAQYANDPAAQACAPGPYLAVWRVEAAVLGTFELSLPIFVVHPAGASSGIELRFCAPFLTTADGKPVSTAPVPLDSLAFFLGSVTLPAQKGDYVWHAFVTPQTPGTGSPNEAAVYELRAIVPVPHVLAVKGRYDAAAHAAVLTGRVTAAGKPQPHAEVDALSANAFEVIRAHTDAAGRFTIRRRISQTTTFDFAVPDQTGKCQGASTAPGGCVSTTISAAFGRPVRVVVPPGRG